MKEINDLHKKAMTLAHRALEAQDSKDVEGSINLYKQAFDFECAAAMLLYNANGIEPSRSVLFRSAGWLAFNAGDYEMAQKMINFAKKWNYHLEIKSELDELQCAISQKKKAKWGTIINLPNIQRAHEITRLIAS